MERKQMMAYALGAAMVGGSLIGTTAVLAGPAPADVEQVEMVDTRTAEPTVVGASDETTVLTEAAPAGEPMDQAGPNPGNENAQYDEAQEAEHEDEDGEAEHEEGEDAEAENHLEDEDEDEDHQEDEEDHEDEHGAY